MKTLFLSLIVVFGALQSWSQTVQIGTVTSSQINLPVFTNGMYSYSQQIITHDEIIAGGYVSNYGNITRIRYHFTSHSGFPNNYDWRTSFTNSNAWKIYIGHTKKTSFSSTTDWEPIAELKLSFDDTIASSFNAGWGDIFLQTPFQYDGKQNLVIAIDENSYWYTPQHNYYSSYTNTVSKGISSYSQGSGAKNPDPNLPPSGTLYTTIPSIQLYFQESCPSPASFTVKKVNATDASIYWKPQGNETLWNIRYKAINDEKWTDIKNINTTNYNLTNLFSIETYIVQIQANCGNSTSEWVNPISFSTPKIPDAQYGVNWEIFNNKFVNDYNLMNDNLPDKIVELTSLITPNYATGMDHFLSRIKGYIVPRKSGEYSFYFACDDRGQFWLSPDSSSAKIQLKSEIIKAQTDWTKNISTQSLVAGEKYFFEILHYDSIYTDLIQLGWKIPGDTVPVIIKSPYLFSSGDNVPVSRILMLDKDILAYPNWNITPRFQLLPWNASNKSIKWISSDESIATVGTTGVIKTIKAGNCKIIAIALGNTDIRDTISLKITDNYRPFFVKPNGKGEGKSWNDAINLVDLLDILNGGPLEQKINIYVSEGVYKPTNSTDRNKSFILNSMKGIRMLGGYDLTSSGTDTTKRDITDFETILSGDIGEQGESIDNSYHVLKIFNLAKIEGITISDGRASCSIYGWTPGVYFFKPDDNGGGIYISSNRNAASTIYINKCKMINNSAWNGGGGMFIRGTWDEKKVNIYIYDCDFSYNLIQQQVITTGGIFNIVVNGQGAGIFNGGGELYVSYSNFHNNSSDFGYGKAIMTANANTTILGSSFYDNIGYYEDLWAKDGSTLNLNNSTVVGSIVSFSSTANIKSSTIVGGGYVSGTGPKINMDNSIWTNVNLGLVNDTSLISIKYSILNNNLYGSSKYKIISDRIPLSSLWLDPIANNGGLTPTMKINDFPGNPAKYNGNQAYLGTYDQRRILRTGSVSIGAYHWVKPTATETIEATKSVNIFPNPFSNLLVIEKAGNSIKTDFEIFNSIGQVIYNGFLDKRTVIPTTVFAPGMYLIKLKSGNNIEFRKVLKN